MFRRVLLPGILLASLVSVIAAPPAWWSSRGATNANPPNDDAAVNQGQLKQFTQKAVQELNARIPGGAGPDLNGLVNGWVQAYQSGGYNASNPLPADFEAMNSGQLKWIANKVHARLVFAKYEEAAPVWLGQNPAADHQLVNLGQLKTVFNFDLTAPPGQLPAWWQKFYFGGQTGIDPTGDDDGDELNNAGEYANRLMPDSWDTDGDYLPDGWEIAHDLDALDDGSIHEINGASGDPDEDGIFNYDEYWYGTNPRSPDTDSDGLSDDEEIYDTTTDPTEADSDHDGIMDPAEDPDHDGLTNLAELRTHLTFPGDSDTDNDTLLDGWEVDNDLDPLVPNSITDPDGDGLTNVQEQYLGTGPLIDDTDNDQILDGAEDPDGDGLSNLVEFNTHLTDPLKADTDGDELTDSAEINIHLTDPLKHDTDGDRLPDGWEIRYALNALNPNGANGADGDTDPDGELNPGDRLSHLLEFINKTDPTKQDTDGDGTSDFNEIAQGSDPTDPSDNGQPPSDRVIDVPFKIYGDYASWEMKIKGLGRDQREILVITPAINVPETKVLKLWRNNKYKITLRFTGSKDAPEKPWYCWEARVGNQPGQQTFNDYQPGRIPGVAEFFTIGDGHWLVDNRGGLFTAHNHRTASRGGNATAGLESFLVPVDIDDNTIATGVDDLSVTADPQDIGYQEKFWIMAPAGTVPNSNPVADCENDMHFKIPLDPAADLKIESVNVKPNPTTTALSAATTLPTVTWHGTTAETEPDATLWKLGPAEQEVDLPIRVKVMKKQTVKVAVWPIRRSGHPPFFANAAAKDATEADTKAYLDKMIAFQTNAWFDVDVKDEIELTAATDHAEYVDGVPYTFRHGAKEKALIDAHRSTSVDINLYLIKGSLYFSEHPTHPLAGPLLGSSYPSQDLSSENYANCCVVSLQSNSAPFRTMAHEIGHLMVGPGHPDKYEEDNPSSGGKAPLQTLPISEHKKRLMCSGDNSDGNSKLLVTTEWDEAEKWLSTRTNGDN